MLNSCKECDEAGRGAFPRRCFHAMLVVLRCLAGGAATNRASTGPGSRVRPKSETPPRSTTTTTTLPPRSFSFIHRQVIQFLLQQQFLLLNNSYYSPASAHGISLDLWCEQYHAQNMKMVPSVPNGCHPHIPAGHSRVPAWAGRLFIYPDRRWMVGWLYTRP